jgi:hypothetical protein
MALGWSKLLQLLGGVGLHCRTESLEQFGLTRVLGGARSRAELAIALQIGQDMLGFRFGGYAAKR